MPIYDVFQFKSLLKEHRLILVMIREDSIRPRRSCRGICQSDGGCCGFFEGLSMDGDEPAAICSAMEEVGDGRP